MCISVYWLALLGIPIANGAHVIYKKPPTVTERDLSEDVEVRGFSFLSGIYPGTKWCGLGNIAENYDDLGSKRALDMCCRAHDHCPEFIRPGEHKYGLYNDKLLVKLHCDCDRAFKDCLVNDTTDSTVSVNAVGIAYFLFANSVCFKKDYPIINCKDKTWFTCRCKEYNLDKTGKKKYQWFDNPSWP